MSRNANNNIPLHQSASHIPQTARHTPNPAVTSPPHHTSTIQPVPSQHPPLQTPTQLPTIPPRVSPHLPPSFSPAVLDIFETPRPPTNNPLPYPTHTTAPNRHHPHSTFPPSTLQQPNPPFRPTFPSHPAPQPNQTELPTMWPSDPNRFQGQSSRSQSRLDRNLVDPHPHILDFPSAPLPYEGTPRDHRPSSAYSHPLTGQALVASGSQTRDKPSKDTRKGKDRVQRACTKCGHMNHIRKKECSKCKEPKEPPKKRTKRAKKRKTDISIRNTRGYEGLSSSSIPHTEIQSGIPHAMSSQYRGHDPRDEMVPSLLDSKSIFSSSPSLPHLSTDDQTAQSGIYHHRSSGFSEGNPF